MSDEQPEEPKRLERSRSGRERILVCVGEHPSEALLRYVQRMAARGRVPWLAVHVESLRSSHRVAAPAQVQRNLALAEELGGESVILSGHDVAAELIAFAREREISQIVIGRRPRRRLRRLRRTLAQRLLVPGWTLTVAGTERGPAPPPPVPARSFSLRPYLLASGIVALGGGLAYVMSLFLAVPHLSLAFLAAVLVAAVRLGLAPALYASVLGFLAFNFFFTQPRFTFDVHQREDMVTLLFFLLVAVVSGNVAARARAQVDSIRAGARINRLLFDFSRRIAGAVGRDDLACSAREYVAESLECHAIVLLADEQGALRLTAGRPGPEGLLATDTAAAEAAMQRNEPTGRGSGTVPESRWMFMPLRAAERPSGVLGVSHEERGWQLSMEQRHLLRAMRDQVSVALEGLRRGEQMERAQLVSETEKLRTALLSSVSHDLRTPLVSIMGSTGTLLELQGKLDFGEQRELLTTVMEEAERLNRYVQNLLDMTRLGYGAIEPKREWADLRDAVAAALRAVHRQLAQHPVEVEIPADFPWVFHDPLLVEQVLVNLLDNAAKYSAPGAPIAVRARLVGERPQLQVADRGPGIPEAEREAVFNMFRRVRAGDSRNSGAGLGLAICRGFVEAMGGELHARPAAGGGTLMEMTLPPGQQPRLPKQDETA